MLLIGLTGSIATGKSTVSELLSQPPYNLPVIDADLFARKVVEPGTPGYEKIVKHFGPTTPDLLLPAKSGDDHGSLQPLNRPALGRRVFGDDPTRKRDREVLNGIVHPAVKWEMYRALLSHYVQGYWAVVLDIPLLFESGWDLLCGTVIVVAVNDPKIQMQRLCARDPHLSQDDARNRTLSQTDVREKARRAEQRGFQNAAGVVVWNDSTQDELKQSLAQQMEVVKRQSPSWWRFLLLLVPPMAIAAGTWSVFRSWLARRRWLDPHEKKS